eukprot:TRINITY_DN15209_c0_g1_i2.p1 TRINITY_DN15209_c0_g1~~TRINITY_DN15209_c0_g1_i2.p1  ORF type:complete len:333 (+),score=73.89 TRINITY_DN15209_c0_g1_i2:169-1167(+)
MCIRDRYQRRVHGSLSIQSKSKAIEELEGTLKTANNTTQIDLQNCKEQQQIAIQDKQLLEEKNQQLLEQIQTLNAKIEEISLQKQDEQKQNAQIIQTKNEQLKQSSSEKLSYIEEQQKQQSKMEQINQQIFQYDNMVIQLKQDNNILLLKYNALQKNNQLLQQQILERKDNMCICSSSQMNKDDNMSFSQQQSNHKICKSSAPLNQNQLNDSFQQIKTENQNLIVQDLDTLSQSDISAQESSIYKFYLQQSNLKKKQNQDGNSTDLLLVAETKKIRSLQKKIDFYNVKNQYYSMQIQNYQKENKRYKFAFQTIILPLFIFLFISQIYNFIIN